MPKTEHFHGKQSRQFQLADYDLMVFSKQFHYIRLLTIQFITQVYIFKNKIL